MPHFRRDASSSHASWKGTGQSNRSDRLRRQSGPRTLAVTLQVSWAGDFGKGATMATRKALDRRPGPLPDIQTDEDSVSFTFDLADLDARLVVRCDGHGDVFI